QILGMLKLIKLKRICRRSHRMQIDVIDHEIERNTDCPHGEDDRLNNTGKLEQAYRKTRHQEDTSRNPNPLSSTLVAGPVSHGLHPQSRIRRKTKCRTIDSVTSAAWYRCLEQRQPKSHSQIAEQVAFGGSRNKKPPALRPEAHELFSGPRDQAASSPARSK